MKTVKNVFDTMLTNEAIKDAFNEAKESVKKKKYPVDMDSWSEARVIKYYRRMLVNYEQKHHKPIIINDGSTNKKREIVSPSFDEVVIQHLVTEPIKQYVMKRINENAYGSIPGRGLLDAAKKVSKWLRKKKSSSTNYCLQIDIKKFFNSIDLDILKEKIANVIPDKRYMDIVSKILSERESGVPLGFYTSHWFAQFYLLDFDDFVCHNLKPTHYVRYMDDILLFSNRKRAVKNMLVILTRYLKDNLNLRVKENYKIIKVSAFDDGFEYDRHTHTKHRKRKGDAIHFVGFVFRRRQTTLRKSILKKIRRKALKIEKKGLTIRLARQFLSYYGWLKYTDTRGYYKRHIKPHVSIEAVRKYVSCYDRRKSKMKKKQKEQLNMI